MGIKEVLLAFHIFYRIVRDMNFFYFILETKILDNKRKATNMNYVPKCQYAHFWGFAYLWIKKILPRQSLTLRVKTTAMIRCIRRTIGYIYIVNFVSMWDNTCTSIYIYKARKFRNILTIESNYLILWNHWL